MNQSELEFTEAEIGENALNQPEGTCVLDSVGHQLGPWFGHMALGQLLIYRGARLECQVLSSTGIWQDSPHPQVPKRISPGQLPLLAPPQHMLWETPGSGPPQGHSGVVCGGTGEGGLHLYSLWSLAVDPGPGAHLLNPAPSRVRWRWRACPVLLAGLLRSPNETVCVKVLGK